MHDPRIVAFSNKVFTVWHVDPETDGSDDSCGWSAPKTSKEVRAKIKSEAAFEYDFYFGTEYQTISRMHTASCYEVIYAIWSQLGWRLYREHVTPQDLIEIASLASNPSDNLRSLVYAAKHDKEEFVRLWHLVHRCRSRVRRPWYRHPRWHLKHLRLQIHPWQRFKRWAFERCAGCRGRYRWGYSPTGSNGKTFHHDCFRARSAVGAGVYK